MSLSIEIASDLPKLESRLVKARLQVQVAIARGLNEGGDKVRTQVRRAMREQTSLLKLASVTSRSSTIRAFPGAPKSGIGPEAPGSLAYVIVFRGKPSTKPREFRVSVKTGPGGGVTVVMWGVAHKFKRSFMQANKGGLRARLGAPRLPIRGFDGPNLAKEAVKDEVAATFLSQSVALVPPMIDKHLAKLL